LTPHYTLLRLIWCDIKYFFNYFFFEIENILNRSLFSFNVQYLYIKNIKNIIYLVSAIVIIGYDDSSSSSYSDGGGNGVYIDNGIIKAKDWVVIGDSGFIKGRLYLIVDRTF
jgi:hypothetical protein